MYLRTNRNHTFLLAIAITSTASCRTIGGKCAICPSPDATLPIRRNSLLDLSSSLQLEACLLRARSNLREKGWVYRLWAFVGDNERLGVTGGSGNMFGKGALHVLNGGRGW